MVRECITRAKPGSIIELSFPRDTTSMSNRSPSQQLTIKRLLVLTTCVAAVCAMSNLGEFPIALSRTKGHNPITNKEIVEISYILRPATAIEVQWRTLLCVCTSVLVTLEYFYSSIPKSLTSRLLLYSALVLAFNVAFVVSHHPQAWNGIFASLSATLTLLCVSFQPSGRLPFS